MCKVGGSVLKRLPQLFNQNQIYIMDYSSLKIGSFAMASSMGAEMVTSNIVDDLSSGANIITQIVILIVTFIKMFKKSKN